jgi:hypothetical protein
VILHLAISIFATLVRGHAETANRGTLGGVPQLGIASEISHENYFIEGHEEPFFFWVLPSAAILQASHEAVKRDPVFNFKSSLNAEL